MGSHVGGVVIIAKEGVFSSTFIIEKYDKIKIAKQEERTTA
jgi:hypothetical protein